jgi:hypothetical protein
MERLARRDRQALEPIYDLYSRAVYSLPLRILRDPAAAEELE